MFQTIISVLLQLNEVATKATEDVATVATHKDVTLISLIQAGGWVMIPIFLCSFFAIYVTVERFLTYRKFDQNPQAFLDKIKSYVVQGDIKSAQMQCEQVDTPFSRMISKGLSKIGTPLNTIEASIENVGKIEVYSLEKNLALLASIAALGPMLGFLGTVTGMIQAFIAISQEEGTISPKLLSAGMYEAMVTTVAGLVVGIIALAAYNYLVGKLQRIIYQMEFASIEFLELLQQPK
jgi:biopolymer transport protein ExbB